jgi:hypothetical protein
MGASSRKASRERPKERNGVPFPCSLCSDGSPSPFLIGSIRTLFYALYGSVVSCLFSSGSFRFPFTRFLQYSLSPLTLTISAWAFLFLKTRSSIPSFPPHIQLDHDPSSRFLSFRHILPEPLPSFTTTLSNLIWSLGHSRSSHKNRQSRGKKQIRKVPRSGFKVTRKGEGGEKVLAQDRRRSSPLAAKPPGKLEVLGLDGDSLGVDGAQVGIFEEGDEVGFRGFLKGHDGTE